MLAFRDHFLGPNTINHIQNQDEQKIFSLSFQGEINNWTFERFVIAHKEYHTILEGLTDHGYCGVDAMTEVNCILDGKNSLDAVNANIMQHRKLFRDVERCVNFYKDFIKQSSGIQINEAGGVAEVGLHKKVNNDIENRYFSTKEYNKLSTNAREKLRKLLKGRPQGGTPRGGGEKRNKPPKKTRKFEQKAKKLQRTIKKLEVKRISNDDDNKSNSSDYDDWIDDDVARPNHNHPILTRQATREGGSKQGGKK